MKQAPSIASHLRDAEAAEALASHYLTAQGLHVIARNWRARGGEIDLVCEDGKTLVFVEVRLRRSQTFGGAGASITPAKRQRLLRAAQQYLQRHAAMARNRPCRFDAVLLSAVHPEAMTWLKDIFSLA